MKIDRVECGIHTIELYAKDLTYQGVQRVIDRLVEQKSIQKIKSDPYNIDRHLKSTYLVEDGIRLRIHQSHDKSNGIAFKINPNTLLSQAYEPTGLFRPKKASCRGIKRYLERAMPVLGLAEKSIDGNVCGVSPEDMSLSQMDLTMNLWFDEDVDLTELIRLFRKSNVPRHFKRKPWDEKEVKKHYFAISANGILIKAYDKVYELKQNDRCPQELEGKKLLRIEVSLKRGPFLKKLGLDKGDSLYQMLHAGYVQAEEIIHGYLEKMFPCSGIHMRYEIAQKRIQTEVADDKLQEQMLFLLKKTSGGAGLDTATQKLRTHYHVKKRQVDHILSAFQDLGINPIPLTNESTQKEILPLLEIMP